MSTKRERKRFFGQGEASTPKEQAALDRVREWAHVAYACEGCPHTRDYTCVWVCARERVGVDPHA